MAEELQRLKFSEDKESIMYTLGRLNPKYLIGLYIKARRKAQFATHMYMVDDELDYDSAKDKAYTHTGASVVYDGVTFIASCKTLKEEMQRRIEAGQINVNPEATTLKTRWTVNKNKKK